MFKLYNNWTERVVNGKKCHTASDHLNHLEDLYHSNEYIEHCTKLYLSSTHQRKIESNKTTRGNKTRMIAIIHRPKSANCLGRNDMWATAYSVCVFPAIELYWLNGCCLIFSAHRYSIVSRCLLESSNTNLVHIIFKV